MPSLLGGFLSPALTVATQAAGGYQHAQAQAAQQKEQQILQSLQLARQQKDAQLREALTNAQIGNYQSETAKRDYDVAHPQPQAPVMGSPEWEHAKIREAQIGRDYGYHPDQRDTFQAIQSVGPDGQPVYATLNTRSGQITPTDVPGKPGGGAGGAAQGAQVPVADMEQRYQEIANQATALGQGKWKMTPGMQTREGYEYAVGRETASGHPSLPHILTSQALNTIGVGGDDYAHYQALMNSSRALGDDVAKVFKGRQNEEAVNREVQLARLTPDDYSNPTVVEQKLSRLRHIIDLARINNPAQAHLGGSATPPTTLSDADLWEQYVNEGMTPEAATAKVRARHTGGP